MPLLDEISSAQQTPQTHLADAMSQHVIEQAAPKPPGFVQSVVQGIAHPFLKAYTSLAAPVEAASDLAFGHGVEAADKEFAPRDYGYFGKDVTAIGSNIPTDRFAANEIGQALKEDVGTGAQIAPYLMGGFSPKNPSSFLSTLNAAGKSGALSGGLSGFGRAIEKRNITPEEVAGDTALNALTGYGTGVAFKAATTGVKRLFDLTTGLKKGTLGQIYDNPSGTNAAQQTLKDNPNNPYYPLAEKTAKGIAGLKSEAKAQWSDAARAFEEANPGTTFDVSSKVDPTETLSKFNVDVTPTKKGFVLTQGKHPLFPPNQLSLLQRAVNEVQGADAESPSDILNLKKVLGKFYDAVPFAPDGSPTPYHAVLSQLKEDTADAVSKVLPEDLQGADALYKAYYTLYEDFGRKIGDYKGNVKPGAEQFLANSGSYNKGVLRDAMERASASLGFNPVEEVQNMKNAQAINHLIPPTGGRTADVLRTIGIGGAAAGSGLAAFSSNPALAVPAGALALASSPALVGNAVKLAGYTAPVSEPLMGLLGKALTMETAKRGAEKMRGLFEKYRLGK